MAYMNFLFSYVHFYVIMRKGNTDTALALCLAFLKSLNSLNTIGWPCISLIVPRGKLRHREVN